MFWGIIALSILHFRWSANNQILVALHLMLFQIVLGSSIAFLESPVASVSEVRSTFRISSKTKEYINMNGTEHELDVASRCCYGFGIYSFLKLTCYCIFWAEALDLIVELMLRHCINLSQQVNYASTCLNSIKFDFVLAAQPFMGALMMIFVFLIQIVNCLWGYPCCYHLRIHAETLNDHIHRHFADGWLPMRMKLLLGILF